MCKEKVKQLNFKKSGLQLMMKIYNTELKKEIPWLSCGKIGRFGLTYTGYCMQKRELLIRTYCIAQRTVLNSL